MNDKKTKMLVPTTFKLVSHLFDDSCINMKAVGYSERNIITQYPTYFTAFTTISRSTAACVDAASLEARSSIQTNVL